MTIADRYFIITAGHVCAEHELPKLAIPTSLDTTQVCLLGTISYSRPTTELIDVGIIEVFEPGAIGELKKHWQFTTLNNVFFQPRAPFVFIVGYPQVYYSKRDNRMRTAPFVLATELIEGAPPDASGPVIEGLDLFYVYDKRAQVLGKGIQDTPPLPGISGASVWAMMGDPENGFWSPDKCVKIVAIQTAYRPGSYVRAQNWLAVAKALAKTDEGLKNALAERTGGDLS